MKNLFYYVLLASGFIAGFVTYNSIEYASTGEWLSPAHALLACVCSMWFLFTTIMFINRSGKEEGYNPWAIDLAKEKLKRKNYEILKAKAKEEEGWTGEGPPDSSWVEPKS